MQMNTLHASTVFVYNTQSIHSFSFSLMHYKYISGIASKSKIYTQNICGSLLSFADPVPFNFSHFVTIPLFIFIHTAHALQYTTFLFTHSFNFLFFSFLSSGFFFTSPCQQKSNLNIYGKVFNKIV